MQNKTEINILDLRSRQAGTLSIELLPCDENGNPVNENSLKIVHNPKGDLINKNISFMLKINSANISHKLYEVKQKSIIIYLKNTKFVIEF